MYNVFYLNDGYMLTLDMPPMGGHFRDLTQEITYKTGVLPQDQVFFLSGGEAIVGDYELKNFDEVGTTSNPIYFIKRVTHDGDSLNSREEEGVLTVLDDFKRDIAQTNQLPLRPNVISQYKEHFEKGLIIAQKIHHFCVGIHKEHEYLNYGWGAVATNVENNIDSVLGRHKRSVRLHQKLFEMRKAARLWTSDFSRVFAVMSKITIPDALLNRIHGASSSPEAPSEQTPVTLFDWVSQQDPELTLEEVIATLSAYFDKADEKGVKIVSTNTVETIKKAKNSTFHDIGGLTSRMELLKERVASIEQTIAEMKRKYAVTTKACDPNNLRDVFLADKNRMALMLADLEDLQKHAKGFLHSKIEVLSNVRRRMSGWMRATYETLQHANDVLNAFEHGFIGFRDRLQLVRQIRESPLVYIRCVTEVIRRHSLKAEFDTWFYQFSQKAGDFIKEENGLRAEFRVKIEKSFLYELFYGMWDDFPEFVHSSLKYDEHLPVLNADDLRALRDSVSDVVEDATLFQVQSPQVFSRLMVEDPSLRRTDTHSLLHREESFFTREQLRNFNEIGMRFPSATWTIGEDGHIEMSPSTQSFISRNLGSTTSLNTDYQVTTPSDLVPSLEQINNILIRKDSIIKDLDCGSIDLNCPSSLHPDKLAKVTSPLKGRRISRASTPSITSIDREYPKPIFEEGVQVESPPEEDVFKVDDLHIAVKRFAPTKSQTTTPLYSPTPKELCTEEKTSQTLENEVLEASTQVVVSHLDSGTQMEIGWSCAETQAETQSSVAETQANPLTSHADIQATAHTSLQETQTDDIFEDALTDPRFDFEFIKSCTSARSHLTDIVQALGECKNFCVEDINAAKAQATANIEEVLSKAVEEISKKDVENHAMADRIKQLEEQLENTKRQAEELQSANESLEAQVDQLQSSNDRLSVSLTAAEARIVEQADRFNEVNTELLNTIKVKDEAQAEVLRLETENKRLENRPETESNEDYLSIELGVVGELLKRELNEDELNWIKQEIEQRINVKRKQLESCESALRTDYETACRNKMAFLLRGIEEKKNNEIAALRESMEKSFSEVHNKEVDELKSEIKDLKARLTVYNAISQPDPSTIVADLMSPPGVDSIMGQSCMVIEEDDETFGKTKAEGAENSPPAQTPETLDEDDDFKMVDKNVDSNTIATQTKLKIADMNLMISLHDVTEGQGVMLIYGHMHSSWMVFTCTGSLYFVKQRSLRRLGIQSDAPDNQFKLLFAKIATVELCETKKAPNRYNLATNTRFYRTDVVPMPSIMAGLTLQISPNPILPRGDPESERDPDQPSTSRLHEDIPNP